MDWLVSILLGAVEGITEFLPISSTGHLTIVEKLVGWQIDAPGVTAFTAIIQIGSIAAAIVYFWKDIVRLVVAWVKGLFRSDQRQTDYRLAWAVIVGSIPIAVVGLAFKNVIETTLRSLWVVAGALIVWSVVMWLADRYSASRGKKALRDESSFTIVDGLIIGTVQCLALIPGVSRSGATISTGLLRGLDRVTATRWSFFLGIPALTASGILEAVTNISNISAGVGWGPTAVATVVAFGVGYAAIAWLLKFVSSNRFTLFVVYRVVLGLAVVALLTTGILAAV